MTPHLVPVMEDFKLQLEPYKLSKKYKELQTWELFKELSGTKL